MRREDLLERRRAAKAVLLVLTCISGCGSSIEIEGPVRARLPAIDLDELEPGVREQYRVVAESVEAAVASAAEPRAKADAYGTLGSWLEVHNLDGSEEAYLAAVEFDPANPRWHYHLASLYGRLGRIERAEAAYDDVLTRAPGHVPTLLARAGLALQAGDAGAAREDYSKALGLRPTSAAALVGLGRLALEAGEAELAVERLEAALDLQPAASSVRYLLGRAYAQVGDDRAEEMLRSGSSRKSSQRLVSIEDDWLSSMLSLRRNAAVYVDSGIRARRRGDRARALRLFELASDSAPTNARPLLEWAATLRLSGDLAEAERKAERALELSPRDPRAHLELGLVRAAQNSPEALEELEAAARLDPKSVAAWYFLGEELRRMGFRQRAGEAFDSAIELDPKLAAAHHGRAVVWAADGRIDEATASLERAEVSEPGRSLLVALRARLLAVEAGASRQRVERARSLLGGLGRDTVHSAESRAMVLAVSGDFEAARAWQRAAVAAVERGPAGACHDELARSRLDRYRRRREPPMSVWEQSESICQRVVAPPAGVP